MIRLKRGEKPAILATKHEEWTREFTAHVGPLSTMPKAQRYRYRHPDIKAAVKSDTHGKCVYCESYVSHVHPGEIEHIAPVSARPALVVDWENLTYVCSECNREKGAYFEPTLPLLNPFVDEPGEHLVFYGTLVLHRSPSPRGEVTVQQLKLDRVGLLERRKERIEQLKRLIDRIVGLPAGPQRTALENVLSEELEDDKPYAATARAFVHQDFVGSQPAPASMIAAASTESPSP
jgi:hypothetical protein